MEILNYSLPQKGISNLWTISSVALLPVVSSGHYPHTRNELSRMSENIDYPSRKILPLGIKGGVLPGVIPKVLQRKTRSTFINSAIYTVIQSAVGEVSRGWQIPERG